MLSKNHLKKIFAFAILGSLTGLASTYAQEKNVSTEVHEAEYVSPLPLTTEGGKIDVLVHIKDNERGHYFNLIFVEKPEWPEEKKEHLMKLYRGKKAFESATTQYPVKLRFRMDSVESKNGFSVDTVVAERNGLYLMRSARGGAEIWRANIIYAGGFEPGVYRIRIDNLNPVPEIDFDTLFSFQRDNRKY